MQYSVDMTAVNDLLTQKLGESIEKILIDLSVVMSDNRQNID